MVHENPFDPKNVEKQTVEIAKATGNVHPEYGVRMKNQSKTELHTKAKPSKRFGEQQFPDDMPP